ncbi:MAG: hypothetical protein ACREB3_13520, partial [Burkholderiales bacterium]
SRYERRISSSRLTGRVSLAKGSIAALVFREAGRGRSTAENRGKNELKFYHAPLLDSPPFYD